MKSILRLATVTIGFLTALPALSWADGYLVFGGTGQLGSEIVRQLINAGETEITVFARPTSNRQRLEGFAVDYIVGDALIENDVKAAFESKSFRVAINALAINPINLADKDKDFYEQSQKLISKYAEQTGVSRVILNSAVGVGDSRHVYPERMLMMFGPTLDDKEKAEESLMASGVPYTIIRNFQIIPEPAPITGEGYLTEDRDATGAIGRGDLGILNVYCLRKACENKTFHAIQIDGEGYRP